MKAVKIVSVKDIMLAFIFGNVTGYSLPSSSKSVSKPCVLHSSWNRSTVSKRINTRMHMSNDENESNDTKLQPSNKPDDEVEVPKVSDDPNELRVYEYEEYMPDTQVVGKSFITFQDAWQMKYGNQVDIWVVIGFLTVAVPLGGLLIGLVSGVIPGLYTD
mmetsp:Transcript_9223/g.16612  ORF Transcript_9223/g.16612 Transcript_9223/m.16612 type:complete len:160 (-) Transcript_9223:12-491(-)